jgi:hypothetical protein
MDSLNMRWDVTLMLGKALEKVGLLEHPDQSYAQVERKRPGWIASFMSQYHKALQLADSKNSRLNTFYRLHASRLKILLSDIRPNGQVLPPDPQVLKLVRDFNSSYTGTIELLVEEDEDLVLQRWLLVKGCVEDMDMCRKKEPYEHRCIHRKARTLTVMAALAPPGQSPEQLEELYGAMCRPGQELEAARDTMHLLFNNKRSQVVAVWMPEETHDAFEVLNQVIGPHGLRLPALD